jgi:sterol desaturase/sphingolipid hydroxylase (fatty acid hydroxylase superfamily)
MWQYRLFTQSPDSVGPVLLFTGLEFFLYRYHRTSHTALVMERVLGPPFAQSVQPRRGLSSGLARPFHRHVALLHAAGAAGLHADWIPQLGWWEYGLNTPSSYRVHHARNPEYLDAHFGSALPA